MKHLFILTSAFGGGGAERIASLLSRALPASIKKTCILFDPRIDYPFEGNLVLFHPSVESRINLIGRLFCFLKRLIALKRLVREQKPDAVIAFFPSSSLTAVLASRNTFMRVFDIMSERFRSYPIARMKLKFVCRRAKQVIAISEDVKSDLVDNFRVSEKKITVVHNAIDVEYVRALANEDCVEGQFKNWLKEGCFIFISVGRLVTQKGHWHLIRAFREVRNEASCKLVILGEGNLVSCLTELRHDLGLDEDVLLPGHVENPYAYMNNANVFVLSSIWEGFGNVILEAMACGLPVISTDCKGGPREILERFANAPSKVQCPCLCKYGLLTLPVSRHFLAANEDLTESEESLASAMFLMLDDHGLRRKFSERALIRAGQFDIRVMKWPEKMIEVLGLSN